MPLTKVVAIPRLIPKGQLTLEQAMVLVLLVRPRGLFGEQWERFE